MTWKIIHQQKTGLKRNALFTHDALKIYETVENQLKTRAAEMGLVDYKIAELPYKGHSVLAIIVPNEGV